MDTLKKTILTLLGLITLLVLLLWQVTGGDYYTKFEVVEEVRVPIDESDPLAGTGFYEDETETKTVTRQVFRLGLLPTSQGLLDKHLFSVLSILLPLWGVGIVLLFAARRRASP